MIAGLCRPHTASPAHRCPQGGRVALGASNGMAVRRAGGAGGMAVAAPPVAVRRCRPAQPIRKLTTAAFAGVDVGTILDAVELTGPYFLPPPAVRMAYSACCSAAAVFIIEASRGVV